MVNWMRISISSFGKLGDNSEPLVWKQNGLVGDVNKRHQLTDNVDVAELRFRRHSVDLTHVSAVVLFLDIVYV